MGKTMVNCVIPRNLRASGSGNVSRRRVRVQHTTTKCRVLCNGCVESFAVEQALDISTDLRVPKRCGLMIVGIGGNNGTTLAASLIANRRKIRWRTVKGKVEANWLGSLAMCGTVKAGQDEETGNDVYVPIKTLVPLVDPDTLVVGGWDISGTRMSDAVARAQVLPLDLQHQIATDLNEEVEVLPGVYDPSFIAGNQAARANHVIEGSRCEQLEAVRHQIRDFKAKHECDKVIVLWVANTERFAEHKEAHATAANLMAHFGVDEQSGVESEEAETPTSGEAETPPSLVYATAAVLEGCSYINGSPQNTFCAGLVELAAEKGVFLAGDDLKTGQTKFKSVMVDYLVSTALKPTSIASYNHLGNNDGLNLSEEAQFKSKEITKSSVIDDMVASNSIVFPKQADHPDHLVVIKYLPRVGDSKRALDEYTVDIAMGGTQTFVIHNTCEDSLLALPIMLDLVLFTEFLDRVKVKVAPRDEAPADLRHDLQRLHPLCSLLSMFLKAPAVPHHAPVINALFPQKEALIHFIRASAGLPPTDYLNIASRIPE